MHRLLLRRRRNFTSLGEVGTVTVVPAHTSAEEVLAMNPDGVFLSNGPGDPEEAGPIVDELPKLLGKVPIFGICLGHQALAQHLGGAIGHAKEPRHGKASPINHNGDALFDGMANPFAAGRYHALIVAHLPDACDALASSALGENMAFKHQTRPLYGVQFHPESILTPEGRRLIENFLRLCGDVKDAA